MAELNHAIEETPVNGKDERKTKRRKLKKVLRNVKGDFSVRAEIYETYQATVDGRKSFSKTDTDATFMRMKERNRLGRDDFFTSLKMKKRVHMKNGQLKPGYNLQIATENQVVLHYDIFQTPTDTRTLLPFLETYPHQAKLVVADAGYGSEENLTELNEQGIDHLIKYGLFDQEQKRGYKQSSKNLDNWVYDAENDTYTHSEGWTYHFDRLKQRKKTTGFEQEIRVYKTDCPDLAPQKGLYINENYQILKQVEQEKLLSQ